jgi:hypothetical protein
MMRQRALRYLTASAGAVVLAGWISSTALFSSTALAGLVQIEAAQSASPNLVNQWKFEGGSDTTRLDDSKGAQDLSRVAGAGGTVDPDGVAASGDEVTYTPSVNDIIFETGFDGASQAYRPAGIPVSVPNMAPNGNGNVVAQSRAGAGLATAMYQTPTKVTVEAVVKTNAFDSLNRFHYIMASRMGGGADRLYYLAQQVPDSTRDGSSNISGHIGTAGLPAATASPKIVANADTDNWYYVAATIDLSATPAVMNAYSANLTTGEPLTQTVTNATFAINTASIATAANARPWGVGMFPIVTETPAASGIFVATGGQEFFRGAIDNLAMYNEVLSVDALAEHRRLLGVPEPTAALLLLCGGLAAIGMRSRR